MKAWIVAVCFMGLAPVLQAQKVSASVDRKAVSLNEYIQYTVTVENGSGQVILPQMEYFKVVQGPSIGNKTNIFNGQVSRQYTETYVLKPLKAGDFTIPAAQVVLNGKKVASNAIRVEVVRNAESADRINNADNFFAQIKTSKSKVYVGEPIWASYQVFSAYQDVRNWNMDYGEIEGFWTEEVDPDNNLVAKNLNGRRLLTAEARRLLLFPQRSGEIAITPFQVNAERVVSRGFFDRSVQPVGATSAPRIVNVLPLPPGKPSDFVGTWRDYDIRFQANKTDVKANEAINVVVTVSGKGNLKVVGEPDITWPPEFEVYPPEQRDDISISRISESGKRRFEYVVIPRSPGSYEIEGLSQGWFNPDSERYERATTPAIRLEVSPGDGDASGPVSYDGSNFNRSEVTTINQDIRYIKTVPGNFNGQRLSFFGSPVYWSLAGAPLLIVLALGFARRRREQEASDAAGTREKKAARVARKYLAAARAAQGGDREAFNEAVSQALLGYLGDKLRIPLSEFSSDKLRSTLTGRLEDHDRDEVLALVEACQASRFSPVQQLSPEETLERTSAVIQKVEKA